MVTHLFWVQVHAGSNPASPTVGVTGYSAHAEISHRLVWVQEIAAPTSHPNHFGRCSRGGTALGWKPRYTLRGMGFESSFFRRIPGGHGLWRATSLENWRTGGDPRDGSNPLLSSNGS